MHGGSPPVEAGAVVVDGAVEWGSDVAGALVFCALAVCSLPVAWLFALGLAFCEPVVTGALVSAAVTTTSRAFAALGLASALTVATTGLVSLDVVWADDGTDPVASVVERPRKKKAKPPRKTLRRRA